MRLSPPPAQVRRIIPRIDGLSRAKAVAELVTEDGGAESVVCGPGSTCIH